MAIALGLIVQYSEMVPDRTHFHFAVELRASGDVIGNCNLSNAVEGGVAYLGWHFGRAHSGFGYATEAASEVIRFGLEDRKVLKSTQIVSNSTRQVFASWRR